MEKVSDSVSINKFVRRQTKGSGKTYTADLSFEEIASHAKKQLAKGHYNQGYRDGVILVPVSHELIHHFICPFVKITTTTKLKAEFVRRRAKEQYYIQIRAVNGTLLKTGAVDLILYRHDVLIESNEQTTDSEWELISFHSLLDKNKDIPMGPITMMRNQLQLPGGTKAYYESEKWAESVNFWQKYVALSENLD